MREPDVGPVDFCPAEFAIAEFNLEQGVTRYYHEIIRIQPALGYTREARETSEKTHQLTWDLPDAQGNFKIIYDNFMDFLKPNIIAGKIPPIYTRKNILHVLPSLFRRITEAGGKL